MADVRHRATLVGTTSSDNTDDSSHRQLATASPPLPYHLIPDEVMAILKEDDVDRVKLVGLFGEQVARMRQLEDRVKLQRSSPQESGQSNVAEKQQHPRKGGDTAGPSATCDSKGAQVDTVEGSTVKTCALDVADLTVLRQLLGECIAVVRCG
jgi:hypothetical protein